MKFEATGYQMTKLVKLLKKKYKLRIIYMQYKKLHGLVTWKKTYIYDKYYLVKLKTYVFLFSDEKVRKLLTVFKCDDPWSHNYASAGEPKGVAPEAG